MAHVHQASYYSDRCLVHGVATGGTGPLTAKKLIAKNREKSGKIGKKEEKSGRKGKNREGSITLPLLTDTAGYATVWCSDICQNIRNYSVSISRIMCTGP